MVFLLVLLLFGPSKLPQMARDIGRFVGDARRSIDEFKEELTSAGDEEETKKDGSTYQRRKDTPAKREKVAEKNTVEKDSPEPKAEKEEEYDF